MVLEAKRFSGKEALEGGIVDILGGMEECLALVKERKLNEKAKTGVYGELKAEMFRETMEYVTPAGYEREEDRSKKIFELDDERREEGRRRVAEWERNALKAKL